VCSASPSGSARAGFAVGFSLIAYGLAEVTFGNGLIAAFVCGIALGASAHEVPDAFAEFAENVSTIAQVLTFFVFGALIVGVGYGASIPALVGFIAFAGLIARPAAILISFVREKLPMPQKLFIAWFGPKGVASMLFALYVLDSTVDERSLIFAVAAFAILASITAHGLTDTVGASWVERRIKS
jgi:sodium/hydrogen antiporter